MTCHTRSFTHNTARVAGLAVLLAAVGWLALAGSVRAAGIPTQKPGVSIIAQNGFGDHNNSYAWSMDWFKGKLYVGTGRDEECMEGATIQRYYPQIRAYTTNPSPNLHCPASEWNLRLRAEIWQYTPPTTVSGRTTTTTSKTATGTKTTTMTTPPTTTGGSWKEVYVAPKIANPMVKHKTTGRDMAYRGMMTMTNPRTHQQALFTANVTPDEIMPPLLKSHPPGLLRTYDGVHWQFVRLPAIKVRYPSDLTRPMGFRSLLVWRGHLYATATPDLTGDGVLVEITNPFSNHPGLKQVSPPNQDIFEIQKFDGDLYTGTGNTKSGYGVYKTNGRHDGRYLRFKRIVADGGGTGAQVTSVVSMHVYRHRLYVGSSGWYNKNTIPQTDLIRIAPNDEWAVVAGTTRTVDGRTYAPISGMGSGFFNPFTAHFWRMASQGGGMFIGTNDWSYLVQSDKSYAFLQSLLAGELGFDIWGTCDGVDYFAVTRDAFTGDEYDFGGRNLVTNGSNGNDLYIGSANQAQGTTIFDDDAQSCQSLVHEQGMLVRPDALMTDHAASGGTLLSWRPTPGATSYSIERAPVTSITLSLKAPYTVDGVEFDDAQPRVVSPGSPGAIPATLSVPGGFSTFADSSQPYFVDRNTGHYLYEIVAHSALGQTSQVSNIASSATGAPATFAAAQAALAPSTASAATVDQFRTDADSVRGSAGEQLLVAARDALADGHRAAALADVRRVERIATRTMNDNLDAVAERLERRLQYAAITGIR